MARTPRIDDSTLLRLYAEHQALDVVAELSGYYDPNWVARRLRAAGLQIRLRKRWPRPAKAINPPATSHLTEVVHELASLLPRMSGNAKAAYWGRRALIDMEKCITVLTIASVKERVI